MKKIINHPSDVIEDYIRGLVGATPHLARVAGWPVVVRSAATRKGDDRVALVSGGGSGHEPAHAGFVGTGMLDAAVLGPVFTSPSVDAVLAAIKAVATDAGVLLIVKNYTGDRLNFGLAAQLARSEGIRVETVTVADDAALADRAGAGRRGLTSTVLAHKVAGAAAERREPIERIVGLVERLTARSATMGLALGPAHVPGADAPNFVLGEDEVEWGLGIHGEPGRERGPIVPAAGIAAALVGRVVEDRGFAAGDEVAVVVNSLGGTPDLELRILQGEALAEVRRHGLVPRITWAGPFVTSLDMPGASITIAGVDDELLELLTADAAVAAFPQSAELLDPDRETVVPSPFDAAVPAPGTGSSPIVAALHERVIAIAEAIVAAEPELTALDREVGDGDLGINLARGATAVLDAGEALRTQADPTAYLRAVAALLRYHVGGTSGPLYSILLLGVAERLDGVDAPRATDWAEALALGVGDIQRIGGAKPGSRTMVDALAPAVDAALAGETLARVAASARAGADSTAAIVASLGRSSYVGERAIGTPDPGAVAVAVILERLAASPTEA